METAFRQLKRMERICCAGLNLAGEICRGVPLDILAPGDRRGDGNHDDSPGAQAIDRAVHGVAADEDRPPRVGARSVPSDFRGGQEIACHLIRSVGVESRTGVLNNHAEDRGPSVGRGRGTVGGVWQMWAISPVSH